MVSVAIRNVLQFTIKVDMSYMYTVLKCTCDLIYIDPYLPPNYTFPDSFEMMSFV